MLVAALCALSAAPAGAAEGYSTFTPTFVQGSTLSASSVQGRFRQDGDTVHVWVIAAGFSGGAVPANLTMNGLPVAAHSSGAVGGMFWLFNAGNTIYTGSAVGSGTASVQFQVNQNGNLFGTNPAVVPGPSDTLRVHITYEAATSDADPWPGLGDVDTRALELGVALLVFLSAARLLHSWRSRRG